ncbi:MAG: hypothetical protein ACJ0K4_06980 [Verrucomicrobiales bacterium]
MKSFMKIRAVMSLKGVMRVPHLMNTTQGSMNKLNQLIRPVTLYGDTAIKQREAVFQKNQIHTLMTIITTMTIMITDIMVMVTIAGPQRN